MSFKISGLDDLQKQLKKMESGAKELSRNKTVSFDVLFNSSFMRKYTNFSDFGSFLTSGNFHVESQEDFEAIPEDDMDMHVQNHTNFSSWEDMLDSAVKNYTIKKLGL